MRPRADLTDDVTLPRLATTIGVVIGILLICLRLIVAPFTYQSVVITIGIGIVAVPISRFMIPMMVGWYLDRRGR